MKTRFTPTAYVALSLLSVAFASAYPAPAQAAGLRFNEPTGIAANATPDGSGKAASGMPSTWRSAA